MRRPRHSFLRRQGGWLALLSLLALAAGCATPGRPGAERLALKRVPAVPADQTRADRAITRAGRKRAQQVLRLSEQLEHDLLAGIAPADLAATRRVLAHICDQLGRFTDKASER